jgi:signal transduction histidine kinase/ligand-binding sensor domain-containing protein
MIVLPFQGNWVVPKATRKPRLSRSALSWLRGVIALIAFTATVGSAVAKASDTPVERMRHARWTSNEGAPSNILAIAQTSDGFLWLGSATGLYRFDGITFERIEPADRDPARSLQVTALLAARDGDLWVGYDYGGVARYHRGQLRSANDRSPTGAVSTIAQDEDGAIWVYSTSLRGNFLRYYVRGKWHWLESGRDMPTARLLDILPMPDRTVLLASFPSVYVRDRVGKLVRQRGTTAQSGRLEKDARGDAWIIDTDSVHRVDGVGAALPLPPIKQSWVGLKILMDRGGDLWVTRQDSGLIRVKAGSLRALTAGRAEGIRFDTLQGITSGVPLSLYQDREGNIWVGGERSLDRLSEPDINLYTKAPQTITTFVPTRPGGPLYFGTSTGIFMLQPDGRDPELALTFPGQITDFCAAREGNVLVLTSRGIFEKVGKTVTRTDIRRPDDAAPVACASDGAGGWWISALDLYHLHGTKIDKVSGPLTALGHAMMMRSPAPGDLLSYRALNGLRLWHAGRVTTLWQGRDIPIGFMKTLVRDGHRWLIGGEHGIALFDGRTFRVIDDQSHPFFANVTGIQPLADGTTWVISAKGIARISTSELMATFDTPSRKLSAFSIGEDLGLHAAATGYDRNDITLDSAGKLWFVTNQGLAWVDPRRLVRNDLPPPVAIRSFTADERAVDVSGATVRLPAGTGRLSIAFTALSLTNPRANHFQYRLIGLDRRWSNADLQRVAYYSNLRPGHYTFEVVAANGDGVWNRRGAAISFDIAPFFYETWWFTIVVILAVVAIALALLRWRTRSIAERVRNRVEARVEERERIARELHDTLLQGVQGLILRFQAVAEVIPSNTRARAMIEQVLERGDDVMVESRERVRDLRTAQPGDIEQRIAALGYDSVDLRVRGGTRPVCAPVVDELVAIVGQALSNVERHARAGNVVVELDHGALALDIFVRDDGIGIAPAIIAAGGRDGHFGLLGMRERAEQLGGRLLVESRPEGGTTIHVRVPARIAYRARSLWPWARRGKAIL